MRPCVKVNGQLTDYCGTDNTVLIYNHFLIRLHIVNKCFFALRVIENPFLNFSKINFTM